MPAAGHRASLRELGRGMRRATSCVTDDAGWSPDVAGAGVRSSSRCSSPRVLRLPDCSPDGGCGPRCSTAQKRYAGLSSLKSAFVSPTLTVIAWKT